MIDRLKQLFAGKKTSRAPHLEVGESGERSAIDYLIKWEGYRLVVTNFRVPLGRGFSGQKLNAEIDAVAYDGATLVFCGVKTPMAKCLVVPEPRGDLGKQPQKAPAGETV